jgi:hypothetical protein
MALKASGQVKVNPVVYRHDPKAQAKSDAEIAGLRRELAEAQRKATFRAAMRAPRPSEVDLSDKEKLWNAEKAALTEEYNKALKEMAELRKFQQPVKYVDKVVEKVVEKPIETVVEKFIEKKVLDMNLFIIAVGSSAVFAFLIGRYLR